jgi:hypothetical protein
MTIISHMYREIPRINNNKSYDSQKHVQTITTVMIVKNKSIIDHLKK